MTGGVAKTILNVSNTWIKIAIKDSMVSAVLPTTAFTTVGPQDGVATPIPSNYSNSTYDLVVRLCLRS